METARIKELVSLLNEYSKAYYVLDTPKVSDSEYDALFDELLSLEKETGTVMDDSPSRRVGFAVMSEFLPHTHIAQLWSLDKVKTKAELEAWRQKTLNVLNDGGFDTSKIKFALEYKFDGLTINLTYDNGKLVQGATRGNGIVGEAILPQIMTISSIPLTVAYKGKFEVQGECYMRLSVLSSLNEKSGERLKNARNAAAGALRNLDPNVTAQRRLSCCCYNIGYIDGKRFATQNEMLDFLKENKLPTSDYVRYMDNSTALSLALDEAESKRNNLDFLIDGMVIKITDFKAREFLGNTDRFPKWAIAYKFKAEEVTTTLENITWEVGRTGKLTPRAKLAPVELAGATISYATLNNWDDIQRKKVGIGSKVFIRRSNDVIPEILSAVEGDMPLAAIEKPLLCPACGAHVEQRGAHIFCTNSLSCAPQITARLTHYASRDAMDIQTFSEKTAALFVEELGLKTIPDLYDIGAPQLSVLGGFGDKKTAKLLAEIERTKDCSLAQFLFGIGIPNIGIKTARDLAKHFSSYENLADAGYEELVAINDVGEVVAQSIIDFMHDDRIKEQIERLFAHGVRPRDEVFEPAADNPILGKTLVVTGVLEAFDRQHAQAIIEKLGGKAASSVSKKTDMVLAGENSGIKLDKARTLGIKVINEAEFLQMIGDNA